MSANQVKEPPVIGWIDGTLGSALLRETDPTEQGYPAKVFSLTVIRDWLRSVVRRDDQPLARTDGPNQSPGAPLANTIWDDPTLWMLMMH
jgi:hypothetical protein